MEADAERSGAGVGWGPFWVWPSRRTWVVLVLAAIVGFWVGMQHLTWRVCGVVEAERAPGIVEQLAWVDEVLLIEGRVGDRDGAPAYIKRIDPSSGRVLGEVRVPPDSLTYLTPDSRHLLVFGRQEESGRVFDLKTGESRKAKSDSLQDALVVQGLDPVRGTVVARWNELSSGSMYQSYAVDVYAGLNALKSEAGRAPLTGLEETAYSKDGRYLAAGLAGGSRLEVRDGESLKVLWNVTGVGVERRITGWAQSDAGACLVVSRWSPTGGTEYEIYDGASGGLLRHFVASSCEILGDGPSGVSFDRTNRADQFFRRFNVRDGRVEQSETLPLMFRPLGMFASSGRIVGIMGSGDPVGIWIWAPGKKLPLAQLGAGQQARVSADERFVAVHGVAGMNSATTIYTRAGWDCPESEWGMAAFVHTWLFALLMVLGAYWYWVDGRRRGVLRQVGGLSLSMVLIGVGPMVGWLLTVLAFGWFWSAWPLVVVAGIGLVSGSRFWRVVAVVLLSGGLVLQIWYGFDVWWGGKGPMNLNVLDRSWRVDRGQVAVARLVMAGLFGAGLVWLGWTRAKAGGRGVETLG